MWGRDNSKNLWYLDILSIEFRNVRLCNILKVKKKYVDII